MSLISQNKFIHEEQDKQGFPCSWFEVAVDMGEKFGTESVYSHTDIEECKKWARENINSLKEKVKGEYFGIDCTLFCDKWGQNDKNDLPMPQESVFTENDIYEGHV